MIGKLKGIVDTIGSDELILDVNGVGYLLLVGARALRTLQTGEPLTLHVETWVRQDQFKLFGFTNEQERAWFMRLQEVQGVGAKSALALLDVLGPDELMQAVLMQDKASVARAQGVGPKLAARIVAELKDKPAPLGRGGAFAPVKESDGGSGSGKQEQSGEQAGPQETGGRGMSRAHDAVSALTNLGFAPDQAAAAVRHSFEKLDDKAGVQELIRSALIELNR